jgi:multidrug efflux pump subunit AcrB
MKTFFKFFAERHLLANLMTISIFLIGGFSAWRMNRSLLPKIDLGQVVISTRYPGASPEDVEINVTNKIEDQLKGITGIKRFNSTSMENSSMIAVTLDIDTADEDKVKTEIREAVARVTDFPPEVTQAPVIREIKTTLIPVIEVGITSDTLSYQELRDYAQLFEKKLQDVPGVASLTRYGFRAREIQVEVSPDKMRQYEIPLREMIAAIQARNIRSSGGTLESYVSEKNVVTLAQFRRPQEVGEVIVRSSQTGAFVRVKDLAVIEDGFEAERVIPRMNGKYAIAFLVTKSETADIVKTVAAVKALVKSDQARLTNTPVQFVYTNDTSLSVRNRFQIVVSNGIAGLVLVLVVLGLFLNLRTSFWVAMGIPVSLFGTMLLLRVFDVDLDSITLTAMALVIGIIVDDAIVISENIFQRRQKGDSPEEATVNGVHEVYRPVLVSMTTTVMAFVPMFLVGGTLGRFIFVIPLVVTLALTVSLFEAYTMLPAHVLPALRPQGAGAKQRPCCRTWFRPIQGWFACFSARLLKWRYLVVLGAIAIFVGSLVYAATALKILLFDNRDADTFAATIELPIGTSLQATADKMREIEALLEKFPKTEIQAYTFLIGAMQDQVSTESEHVASTSVDLTPYGTRARSAEEIVNELRPQIAALDGIKNVTFTVSSGGPSGGKPVSMKVVGDDNDLRRQLADDIVRQLQTIDGVTDIERDDQPGKEEVTINLNYERLARYGLTVADIARNVRIAYDGQIVTSVRYDQDEVNFRVILEKALRQRLDYLRRLIIPNVRGELIALEEVAALDVGPGIAAFQHYGGERAITIAANVVRQKITPLQVKQAIQTAFDLDRDYPGIRIISGGEAQETQESFISLGLTFIIAALGIYFMLVLLFNSLAQPLMVLIAIPFGVSGVIFTFGLHNQPLTFLAMVGVVGLAGVVVNDSLVLVDHLNHLQWQGEYKDLVTLVAMGTADRLRPIVLTSLTTVAGLLPLAYGIGGRDLLMGPMALALGYGLLFATPITLVLLPSLYLIGYDIKRVFGKFKQPQA